MYSENEKTQKTEIITLPQVDIVVDGFLYQLQFTSDSFLWNKRYLQLRNGTLASFKHADNTIILESIPSLEGYVVQNNPANQFAFYSFTLFSSEFSFTFTALNEDYIKYWVNALSAACKRPPAHNPHPPFASLSQSQFFFNNSPLPYPFSSLRFDCSQGIAQIVDSWMGNKSEIDPIREAFSSFEDILQYRYSSKSMNNAYLFDFAIARQFNKMRTLLISSRKNIINKHRYDYFTAEDLCLFLCIIIGEEEGVNILLKESNLELTKHMGGFTPLFLSLAENKPNITKLLVEHSHDPSELKKLINHRDPLENSKDEYLNQLSLFLNATRNVDPQLQETLASLSPRNSTPIPISPLETPSLPSFPSFSSLPSLPSFPFIQSANPSELRLLQLVTSFQIPRATILSVVQSLLNPPKIQTLPEPTATVVVMTETDAYRTLRVSELVPETTYKLHFKMLKLNAHNSELQISNKGEATADASGTARWKIRSYIVCDIEMHVEGPSCVYAPFTCRFTSRKKGGDKSKPSELDLHVVATVV